LASEPPTAAAMYNAPLGFPFVGTMLVVKIRPLAVKWVDRLRRVSDRSRNRRGMLVAFSGRGEVR
jgi:hypothetical protein